MSELRRTLVEDVMYPAHDPRKASAEYTKVHHELVVVRDEPCWICGITHSKGGRMETHHDEIEWAAVNGVDLALVMRDFPDLTDAGKLREWLDSEGNMLVLCASHHRGSRTGVHMVTYPAWKLQRYQGSQWTFIPQTTTV